MEIRELSKLRIHPFSAIPLTGEGRGERFPPIKLNPQVLVLVFSVV